MKSDFMLSGSGAVRLYEQAASELPIIDFHNHLAVEDMASNKRYENIWELWLKTDPYKHRLMRICGVEEALITGSADPYKVFEEFCTVFPLLAGNPVYSWSQMELSFVLGIDIAPSKQNARRIWDEANEKLSSPEYYVNGILKRFNIEYQSPVATLTDDLTPFNGINAAPSLRGDELLYPTEELFSRLRQKTGLKINTDEEYIAAVSVLLDDFHAAGCRIADHSLEHNFFAADLQGRGQKMLRLLAGEYAKRGWLLLLHLGAKRNTSDRLAALAGPAGGYATCGEGFAISRLCDLLNDMEGAGALPDTVLFPLNMGDQAPMSVLQGSFSADGVPSKVQLGPAWWWCDHAMGIENTLSSIASFGVVSQFIGMTTDSRSVLSFVRHDYFRRLLCSWLEGQSVKNCWASELETKKAIIRKICYQNAKDKILK